MSLTSSSSQSRNARSTDAHGETPSTWGVGPAKEQPGHKHSHKKALQVGDGLHTGLIPHGLLKPFTCQRRRGDVGDDAERELRQGSEGL